MKSSRLTTSLMIFAIFAAFSCSKEDDDKKAKVGAKVRSTGGDLSLMLARSAFTDLGVNLAANPVQNSAVTLDYYKVPISRVNLVSGLSGSGYTSASPNIYSCAGTTDDECLINIADKSTVDNLLKTAGKDEEEIEEADAEGADQAEISPATYDGTAVEFCHESQEFSARVKASVIIGDTRFYTNATTGVSTTGPAQEVKIPVKNIGCGMTTPLFEPLTVTDDTSTNVVLYTDPAGALTGRSEAPSNIGCVGTEEVICTDPVGIFSTVDDAAPTVERYSLAFEDGQAKGLLTLVINSSNVVFGASTQSVYENNDDETVLGPMSINHAETLEDGTVNLKIWDNATLANFIEGFKRSNHSGTLKYNSTTSDIPYTATKL